MSATPRQVKGYALILRTQRFSEIHQSVTLFVKELGIIQAVAHGAMKSKSRFLGRLEWFSLAAVDLDYSPKRESWSLKEIEVLDYFAGIREEYGVGGTVPGPAAASASAAPQAAQAAAGLPPAKNSLQVPAAGGQCGFRFWLAGCWADLILQTHALNESSAIFKVTVQSLRLLSAADPPLARRLHLQFLLRLLAFGGLFPSLAHCSVCGRMLNDGETRFLNCVTGETVCTACVRQPLFPLTADEVRYLIGTMKMTVRESVGVLLPPGREKALIRAWMTLIEELLGIHFRSFGWVLGALNELD